MTDKRFDNRTKSEFKKQIRFGTQVETYWFKKFIKQVELSNNLSLVEYCDNGVANDGLYIPTGQKTSGADYMVSIYDKDKYYENLPLEVKFAPTKGKITLKEGDLKGYTREKAAILFIINTGLRSFRMPKNKNIKEHITSIEKNIGQFKWGICWPEKVSSLLQSYSVIPIPYMGGKSGIIIPESDFSSLFEMKGF